MNMRAIHSLILLILASQVALAAPLEGFVLIDGAVIEPGRTRLEAFEILDHPVTNAEYKAYIDATAAEPPLHWQNGTIPAGKEDYPVVFVNREDVRGYLDWLTETDGRVYRLPSPDEFAYAARGGLKSPKYPWGEEPPAGRANYDADGTRAFNRWQDYLAPAKFGPPNGYGLHGMAGNVWQIVRNNYEPDTQQWIYRLEDPELKDNAVMGGSWARSDAYLKCGTRAGLHAALRQPDAGFRPVREPKGADWRVTNRQLCAVSRGKGEVLVSWALLRQDTGVAGFNVYRAKDRNQAGFLVSKQPVTDSTCFLDTGLETGTRYQYYVRPVDGQGKELRRSEWKGIEAAKEPAPGVVTFAPLAKEGSLVPIFGDLNGDGALDCVIRMDNGNREMSQDPGIPVQLEAFTSYGRSLWRRDLCHHDHCYGSANNVPFNVWDMDGDGKAEIIARTQIGDEVFLAILDGMSGKVLRKAPWVPIATDTQGSSTRIHLSIAYLDGEHPAVVTQSGLYENEIFTAFDAELNQLWQYKSFAETSGSGGHKIEIADIDGDGKQEVFDGTTCINHDGTLRWSIYRQHPDIVSIQDYLPKRPGLEVFYIVESSMHAGVYMVDADSGEIIWKLNREDDSHWTHGHSGWTADIWDGSPGIECVSNRAGHNDRHYLLFSASGQLLLEPFPAGYTPFEWDGDATRELIQGDGAKLFNFNGEEAVPVPGVQPNPLGGGVKMVADLYGDFRDELVLNTSDKDGRATVSVVMASDVAHDKFVAASEDLEYRQWVGRNMGGGYPSIHDRNLEKPGRNR